jgi:hypothetical protein
MPASVIVGTGFCALAAIPVVLVSVARGRRVRPVA